MPGSLRGVASSHARAPTQMSYIPACVADTHDPITTIASKGGLFGKMASVSVSFSEARGVSDVQWKDKTESLTCITP